MVILNLKNDTGTAVTPATGPLQESSYKECLELVAELTEEVYPERAELFLTQYLGTDDVDLTPQRQTRHMLRRLSRLGPGDALLADGRKHRMTPVGGQAPKRRT